MDNVSEDIKPSSFSSSLSSDFTLSSIYSELLLHNGNAIDVIKSISLLWEYREDSIMLSNLLLFIIQYLDIKGILLDYEYHFTELVSIYLLIWNRNCSVIFKSFLIFLSMLSSNNNFLLYNHVHYYIDLVLTNKDHYELIYNNIKRIHKEKISEISETLQQEKESEKENEIEINKSLKKRKSWRNSFSFFKKSKDIEENPPEGEKEVEKNGDKEAEMEPNIDIDNEVEKEMEEEFKSTDTDKENSSKKIKKSSFSFKKLISKNKDSTEHPSNTINQNIPCLSSDSAESSKSSSTTNAKKSYKQVVMEEENIHKQEKSETTPVPPPPKLHRYKDQNSENIYSQNNFFIELINEINLFEKRLNNIDQISEENKEELDINNFMGNEEEEDENDKNFQEIHFYDIISKCQDLLCSLECSFMFSSNNFLSYIDNLNEKSLLKISSDTIGLLSNTSKNDKSNLLDNTKNKYGMFDIYMGYGEENLEQRVRSDSVSQETIEGSEEKNYEEENFIKDQRNSLKRNSIDQNQTGLSASINSVSNLSSSFSSSSNDGIVPLSVLYRMNRRLEVAFLFSLRKEKDETSRLMRAMYEEKVIGLDVEEKEEEDNESIDSLFEEMEEIGCKYDEYKSINSNVILSEILNVSIVHSNDLSLQQFPKFSPSTSSTTTSSLLSNILSPSLKNSSIFSLSKKNHLKYTIKRVNFFTNFLLLEDLNDISKEDNQDIDKKNKKFHLSNGNFQIIPLNLCNSFNLILEKNFFCIFYNDFLYYFSLKSCQNSLKIISFLSYYYFYLPLPSFHPKLLHILSLSRQANKEKKKKLKKFVELEKTIEDLRDEIQSDKKISLTISTSDCSISSQFLHKIYSNNITDYNIDTFLTINDKIRLKYIRNYQHSTNFMTNFATNYSSNIFKINYLFFLHNYTSTSIPSSTVSSLKLESNFLFSSIDTLYNANKVFSSSLKEKDDGKGINETSCGFMESFCMYENDDNVNTSEDLNFGSSSSSTPLFTSSLSLSTPSTSTIPFQLPFFSYSLLRENSCDFLPIVLPNLNHFYFLNSNHTLISGELLLAHLDQTVSRNKDRKKSIYRKSNENKEDEEEEKKKLLQHLQLITNIKKFPSLTFLRYSELDLYFEILYHIKKLIKYKVEEFERRKQERENISPKKYKIRFPTYATVAAANSNSLPSFFHPSNPSKLDYSFEYFEFFHTYFDDLLKISEEIMMVFHSYFRNNDDLAYLIQERERDKLKGKEQIQEEEIIDGNKSEQIRKQKKLELIQNEIGALEDYDEVEEEIHNSFGSNYSSKKISKKISLYDNIFEETEEETKEYENPLKKLSNLNKLVQYDKIFQKIIVFKNCLLFSHYLEKKNEIEQSCHAEEGEEENWIDHEWWAKKGVAMMRIIENNLHLVMLETKDVMPTAPLEVKKTISDNTSIIPIITNKRSPFSSHYFSIKNFHSKEKKLQYSIKKEEKKLKKLSNNKTSSSLLFPNNKYLSHYSSSCDLNFIKKNFLIKIHSDLRNEVCLYINIILLQLIIYIFILI